MRILEGELGMRKVLSCLLAIGNTAAMAASVSVSNPEELFKAVGRALKDPAAPREIVLKAGEYCLSRPIVLKGVAASNFTFRAEKPGTVTLVGGVRLAGWTREAGTPFFVADVPGWQRGVSVPFRSLVKNGEWAPIAVYPGGTNRLAHAGKFALSLLSSLAGHWSRKPTHEEYVTMPYRAEDLGDGLRLENADIRLYHMWSDSICTVSNVDRKAHVLCVRQEPAWPMGACDRRLYEVLNLREGLTAPGMWYLDRDAGRVRYWPKAGEDMTRLVFIAPTLPRVISIGGSRWNPRDWISGVTLRDLTVTATTPGDEERASFGGSAISAAISVVGVRNLTVENVTVRNVGGAGMLVAGGRNVRVTGCDVSFAGARGAGFEDCADSRFEGNRIADVGLVYRSSCGMTAGGSNTVFAANEICRAPYCGIIGSGCDSLFASNYIHHVMQVLHDGGAIYGSFTRCTMRGNVARDIVANGRGFGVHAYYADEGSRDCVIEDNYAEGLGSLIHNHMTLRTVVRSNTLVSRGDLSVSFQRSTECAFSNNTLVCDGRLTVGDPDAVPHWERNFAVRPQDPKQADGRRAIGDWTPERPRQRKKTWAPDVPQAARPPVLDGLFASDDWPDRWLNLDRTPDRRVSGFTTASVRFLWDEKFLYAAFMSASFRNSTVREGATWGRDDGVELALPNGVRIRGFLSGKTEVSPAAAGVRAWAGRNPAIDPKKTWLNRNVGHYEFAIPWTALGLRPKKGLKVPFNAFAYMSELGVLKCWEGTDPAEGGTVPVSADREAPGLLGAFVLR